jgi:uncharacterized protein YaeQ
MAQKPTIYKANIALNDLDRNYFDSLELTIAQHPSENLERMMVRVLAYCLNAQDRLTFTAGISTPDEPDIQVMSLDDRMLAWIDVGEPSFDRIKKASRLAEKVKIYSFNTKSDIWWQKEQDKFSTLNVEVYQFDWEQVKQLSTLVERTMTLSMTISEQSVFITAVSGDCEVSWRQLTV